MPHNRPSKHRAIVPDIPITADVESIVGVTLEALSALFLLDGIKGFGPQKFKKIHENFINPKLAIEDPSKIPIPGKTGEQLRSQLLSVTEEQRSECRVRAEKQIRAAYHYGAKILTYDHSLFPRNVYDSSNPIPVLYVRGDVSVLTQRRVVACVGSRKTDGFYAEALRRFVATAVNDRVTVASGFALGADIIGHSTAIDSGGHTICVMPSGLDRPFPPENKAYWDRFLNGIGAAFVSEFPFGRGADSTTLRKRNKLIVAFSRGVLVAQSSSDGGAMNAYRSAGEQGKAVATFAANCSPETTGNQEIANNRKRENAVFGLQDGESEFSLWLHQLFSSI